MALIAIDLDGTLLQSDHTVDDDTNRLLNELRDKGHHIVVATGRTLGTAIHLQEMLGFECDMICGNGSIVYNNKEGIIIKNPLTDEQINQFFDIVEDRSLYSDFDNLYYHAYSEFAMYASTDAKIFRYYKEAVDKKMIDSRFKLHLSNVRQTIIDTGDTIYKFGIMDDGSDDINKIKEKILNIDGVMSIASMPGSKDIMKDGVTKWTAIVELCKLRGVDIKDTICFGNEENDIEMITKAGIGVAMENSNKEVLAVAPNVTKSNNDKGVYEFLKGLDL